MQNRDSNRRWGVGKRLAIGLSLIAFLFASLLLPQVGRRVLAASPERVQNTDKRAKCIQQMRADRIRRSVLAASASYIAPPSAPVRVTPTRFVQGGGNTMQCGGDCPDNYLVCTQAGTFIQGSGCCAVCCYTAFPSVCSSQNCCQGLIN